MKLNNINLNTPVVIFAVFITLKLTHVIDWHWLWVTSPIWISISIGLLIGIGYILATLLAVNMVKNELNKELKDNTIDGPKETFQKKYFRLKNEAKLKNKK